jgi:hypothetical protein
MQVFDSPPTVTKKVVGVFVRFRAPLHSRLLGLHFTGPYLREPIFDLDVGAN